MKRLILAAGFALALAGPAAAQRSGAYDVTGTNPDGSAYTGTMQLEQLGLLSFRVQWVIGTETIEGVGMVSGLTFATAFALGGQPSMGIYELRPNGEMVGQWTIMAAFSAGQETAKPR
ncbi:MAG: hypothetical protein JWR10_4056 [Rubritepida sp.]|nr:hypothetical protein [Rubritepida sp.]